MAEIYVPNAADWINAAEAGREVGMVRRKRRTAQDVGGAMARGDYETAARLSLEGGDLSTGVTLKKFGDEQKLKGRKTEIRKQFATDPEGATAAALEVDEDLYKDLKGLTDEAQKQRYAQFGAILRTIGQQPEDQWDDLIAANRPQLTALQVPEAEINAFISAQPEQRRAMMAAMLARADQFDKFQEQGNKDREFSATQAERKADNTRADRQLSISEQQLALARQREARVAAKGGADDGEWEEF